MQYWGLGKVFKSPGEGYLDFVHKLLSDEGRGGVKNYVIMKLYPIKKGPSYFSFLYFLCKQNTVLIIYWENNLYLHPVDCVEGCRPKTGKSDVSTGYKPSR